MFFVLAFFCVAKLSWREEESIAERLRFWKFFLLARLTHLQSLRRGFLMSSYRHGGILFVERGKGGFLEEIGKEREKEKKDEYKWIKKTREKGGGQWKIRISLFFFRQKLKERKSSFLTVAQCKLWRYTTSGDDREREEPHTIT